MIWFEIIKYGSLCVLFSRILHSDIDKLSEWLSVWNTKFKQKLLERTQIRFWNADLWWNWTSTKQFWRYLLGNFSPKAFYHYLEQNSFVQQTSDILKENANIFRKTVIIELFHKRTNSRLKCWSIEVWNYHGVYEVLNIAVFQMQQSIAQGS